ncbi:diguanylate cyclase (GGDEF)-like protein [Rhizobium sp. BK313]|uniref:putative bifunctional diguanylate cyclase/phosphodiesterase n=1 Tax=Rhizobium sp. BK313 TaxID=2587081 RepID=UPI0010618310|nr:bifunctional diguanylate cyclase/phosphodiesterase [Rhizobium sp. BK313]MBB3454892.1 diguanylate cyclase (GGDEF)-like protein [Rhizobium sp. BK313]
MKAKPQFRSHIGLIRLLQVIAISALAMALGLRFLIHFNPHLSFSRIIINHGFDIETLVIAFVATVAGVFRLRRARQQIEEHDQERESVVERDSLTHAFSRSRFMELLEDRLSAIRTRQIARKPTPDFTLMLIDVDYFKRINDTFGHTVGDRVLKTLVEVASARSNWIVGRIGGDEFAVVADDTDYHLLSAEIASFMDKLRELLRRDDSRSYDGISIGIAQAPLHAGFADALLTRADVALYEAKRNGRNQFVFFDADMQHSQMRERQITRNLRSAILLNHLAVYYQPVIGSDGEVIGAEALVRWRDPIRGAIIPPDEFIPIAEQSALIDHLGEWVFRQVCRDYERSGFKVISINVSGAQFLHDRLVPMLRDVLRETGCRAEMFVLEVTETVGLNATPAVVATVSELKRMGFRLSLDDFGTGNSGFAFLRDMPFDTIKIDKSYVQKLADDPIAQVFVSGVGKLGETLGFRVIAEGIETTEHHQLARLAGATAFQGYLFGRPEPLKPAIINASAA